MLSRKPYTLNKVNEVVVEGVEEVEETIVEEEAVEVSRGGAAGAAPTPIASKTVGRKIVTTTNGHEEAIRKAETAMNAGKQDTSREIVQSDETGTETATKMRTEMKFEVEMEAAVDSMAKDMEPVLVMEADSTAKTMEPLVLEAEAEADSTVKAKAMEPVLEAEAEANSRVKVSEEILDQEVKDPVKEMDTTDRSFLKMAPTIRNDSWGLPPSIPR
jgi:hypothetical protein